MPVTDGVVEPLLPAEARIRGVANPSLDDLGRAIGGILHIADGQWIAIGIAVIGQDGNGDRIAGVGLSHIVGGDGRVIDLQIDGYWLKKGAAGIIIFLGQRI